MNKKSLKFIKRNQVLQWFCNELMSHPACVPALCPEFPGKAPNPPWLLKMNRWHRHEFSFVSLSEPDCIYGREINVLVCQTLSITNKVLYIGRDETRFEIFFLSPSLHLSIHLFIHVFEQILTHFVLSCP